MPSGSCSTALRPLTGPAWGAVASAGALTAVLLGRLPARWVAYHALAAYAGGGPSSDFPGALYDAVPGFFATVGGYLLFGAFLACLGAWVLRARRNAAALRPDHAFRFSPAEAVVCVLVPLGNLWFAGPAVAQITEAGPEPRDRRRSDRAWWLCGLVAAAALVAASVAVAWTPLARQGPATDPLPTPHEVTAQLAVAALHSLTVVALAAMTVLLAVTLARVRRWQRRIPIPPATAACDPPAPPRRGLTAAAVAGAAIAGTLIAAMIAAYVADLSAYAWAATLADPAIAGIIVIPAIVLAVNLAQVGGLVLAAVRFARRPQRSAVVLTAAVCAVAWTRLLFGPPPLQAFSVPLWWTNRAAALACIVTAVLVVMAVRRSARTG